VPSSPQGWLLQTARRKAIDRFRRTRNFESKSAEYARLVELDQNTETEDKSIIPEERLRLIFTCCHPALDERTRIALTLRTLCNLTTTEIARAFIDTEASMAQRLVRARHKIEKAAIPYEIPEAQALPERLQSVQKVIYLVYNEGYAATGGEARTRVDLCIEAIRLGRLLLELLPHDPESRGLLALMLLNHARHPARIGDHFIPLEEHDRTLWDAAMIAEGTALLQQALLRMNPGPYQMQAAISAIHAEAAIAADTRWDEIAMIYDRLYATTENPVYLLNQAVALSYSDGPQAALQLLPKLENDLKTYQPFHAAKADFHRRAGNSAAAFASYTTAIALSRNQSERMFLQLRAKEMGQMN
jgi:RNA polymerase sigma-70 factor, ECF subfamily